VSFDQHFLVLLLYYLVPGLIALLCGTLLKRRARPPVLRWTATILQVLGAIPVLIVVIVVTANLLGI
jgi:hypothetical protein